MFLSPPSQLLKVHPLFSNLSENASGASLEETTECPVAHALGGRNVYPAEPAAAAELTSALGSAWDRVHSYPTSDSASISQELDPWMLAWLDQWDSGPYSNYVEAGSELLAPASGSQGSKLTYEDQIVAPLAADITFELPTSSADNFTGAQTRVFRRRRQNDDSRIPSLAGEPPSSRTSLQDDCVVVEPDQSARESGEMLRCQLMLVGNGKSDLAVDGGVAITSPAGNLTSSEGQANLAERFRNQLARAISSHEVFAAEPRPGLQRDELEKQLSNQRSGIANEIQSAGGLLWRSGMLTKEMERWALINRIERNSATYNRIYKCLQTQFIGINADQVTTLNLSRLRLTDIPLPTALRFLSNLRVVDLSGNYLRSIPEIFRHFPKLSQLRLRCNQFSRWPDRVNELKNLELLDLSQNYLATLPERIESRNRLLTVYLNANPLTGSLPIRGQNVELVGVRSSLPTEFSAGEKLRGRNVNLVEPAAAAELMTALASTRNRVYPVPSFDNISTPEEELTDEEQLVTLLGGDNAIELMTAGTDQLKGVRRRPDRLELALAYDGTSDSPIDLTGAPKRAFKRRRPDDGGRIPNLAEGGLSSQTFIPEDYAVVGPDQSGWESGDILQQLRHRLANGKSTQEILGPLLIVSGSLELLRKALRQPGSDLVQEILAAGRRLYFDEMIAEELMAWLNEYQVEEAYYAFWKLLHSHLSLFGNGQELCLDLSDIDLGNAPLPPALLFVPCVQAINLRGSGLTQVPGLVGGFPNISRLDLSYNKLTKLPSWFARLDCLERLDLSNNRLTTEGLQLPQLDNLTVDLSGNWINDLPINPVTTGPIDLEDPIESFRRQLMSATTSAAVFALEPGPGAQRDQLQKHLSERGSSIADEIQTIGRDLWQTRVLTDELKSWARLNGIDPRSALLERIRGCLATQFSAINTEEVKTLDLSKLQRPYMPLPTAIRFLSGVQVVNLSYNKLTSLPEILRNFPNLSELDLSNNQFTRWPGLVDQLKQLESLNLTANQLTTLPERIEPRDKLLEVFLDGNDLPSSLPVLGEKVDLVRTPAWVEQEHGELVAAEGASQAGSRDPESEVSNQKSEGRIWTFEAYSV